MDMTDSFERPIVHLARQQRRMIIDLSPEDQAHENVLELTRDQINSLLHLVSWLMSYHTRLSKHGERTNPFVSEEQDAIRVHNEFVLKNTATYLSGLDFSQPVSQYN